MRRFLRQHDSKQVAVDDSKYIQNLIKAQQRDPFGSSFLGHSLVTDKGEEGTNSMICDLDDNTLENTLIENQLDDTLVVNNVESPEAVKRSVPSNNKELQGNFLQSTMINTTNRQVDIRLNEIEQRLVDGDSSQEEFSLEEEEKNQESFI